MGMNNKHNKVGKNGENCVTAMLRNKGHKVERAAYGSPFDLQVDGRIRVEVKTAMPSKFGATHTWAFNIHRHNRLKEDFVDVYILRLERVLGTRQAIHLLMKSPVKQKNIIISTKALISGAWYKELLAWKEFSENNC